MTEDEKPYENFPIFTEAKRGCYWNGKFFSVREMDQRFWAEVDRKIPPAWLVKLLVKTPNWAKEGF